MNETTPPATTLSVNGEFTIFTADAHKTALMNAIAQTSADSSVDIDLSAVTEIDTAGLQLMLLAKHEAAAVGRSVTFSNHSDAVLDLVSLFDLVGQLGDPVLLHSSAGK